MVFGRPGASSVALANLELIKALADALASFNAANAGTEDRE